MATLNLTSEIINRSNSGIILGQVLESFILSIRKPEIKGKGILMATNPLLWDGYYLDLNSKSKLYIQLAKGLLNRKVQLTFRLISFNNSPTTKVGNILVNFTNHVQPKYEKLNVPFQTTLELQNFHIKSQEIFMQDSATIEVLFPEYQDIMLESVKVEVFQPLQLTNFLK